MEPIDQNARYTNFLAERLARRGAVINLGISGNQVTSTFIGDNLQARLDRDVLAQAAVTHIVIQGGINDIGLPPLLGGVSASAADIISGLQQIAARARAQGLIVIGATLSPSGSYFLPTYTSTEAQAIRRAVNDWIRTSDSYDLVADFDAALRDPDDTDVLNPIYSADGLHPNSEGYRLMARVVARLLKR
jgi:lysophospholipase L1-like esterase